MSDSAPAAVALKPFKVTCTSTDCTNNLHCFKMTKKLLSLGRTGSCRTCGARLVDWQRIHARNPVDAEYTFLALQFETIRHHFWHVPISFYAINYARRKGRANLRTAALKQISSLVGQERHAREGYQTPRETSPRANAIHYAQHAVAACCRTCIAYWHNIPEGRNLTTNELNYLVTLAMRYIDSRIPNLSEHHVAVPRTRTYHTQNNKRKEGTIRSAELGDHA